MTEVQLNTIRGIVPQQGKQLFVVIDHSVVNRVDDKLTFAVEIHSKKCLEKNEINTIYYILRRFHFIFKDVFMVYFTF